MEPLHPLQSAIDHVGLAQLARELGVTHQAIRKWQIAGRLPRTEWTGETDYATTVERLMADAPVPVTRAELLAPWPVYEAKGRAPATGEAKPPRAVADAPVAAGHLAPDQSSAQMLMLGDRRVLGERRADPNRPDRVERRREDGPSSAQSSERS